MPRAFTKTPPCVKRGRDLYLTPIMSWVIRLLTLWLNFSVKPLTFSVLVMILRSDFVPIIMSQFQVFLTLIALLLQWIWYLCTMRQQVACDPMSVFSIFIDIGNISSWYMRKTSPTFPGWCRLITHGAAISCPNCGLPRWTDRAWKNPFFKMANSVF